MKKIILMLIGINLALVSLLLGLFSLTENHPYSPAEALYRIQVVGESWRIRITAGGENQTNMVLNLLERRLSDLALAETEEEIEDAVFAYQQSFDLAVDHLQELEGSPATERITTNQLDSFLVRSRLLLAAMDENSHSEAIQGLLAASISSSRPTRRLIPTG